MARREREYEDDEDDIPPKRTKKREEEYDEDERPVRKRTESEDDETPDRRSTRPSRKDVGLDVERVRRDYEAARRSDERYFNVGKIRDTIDVRFLRTPGDDLFYRKMIKTFVPGPKDKPRVFISPRSTDPDAYCPATATAQALKQEGRQKECDQVYPQTSYISNALVREKGEKNWRQVVLEYKHSIWKAVVGAVCAELGDDVEPDEAAIRIADIADRKNGRIIVITKTGTGMGTKYATHVTSRTHPATKEELEDCVDLANEVVTSKASEMEDALCAWLGIDDLSEVTGATPGRKKPRRDTEYDDEAGERPRRRPTPKTDDDDEDDERETRHAARRKETHDGRREEEDDDDEGHTRKPSRHRDEEDEPPRKNRRPRADDADIPF